MDYNIFTIKYLNALFKEHNISTDDIKILSKEFKPDGFFKKNLKYLGFRPPHNWPNLSTLNLDPGEPFLTIKH